MEISDYAAGMKLDLTVKGAQVVEVDTKRVAGRVKTQALVTFPGRTARGVQAVWINLDKHVYGEGVQVDAAYTKEPLGQSVARSLRTKQVWQRQGGLTGEWWTPTYGYGYDDASKSWRNLWNDEGPLEVLFDDTASEPTHGVDEGVGDGAPEWEEKGSGD
jgi:hypothetical protein